VIDVAKAVLREVVIREELWHDPTALVLRVLHKKFECGIFSIEELRFP
jgi:hypothetical protein